jgi:hypothetical protein
VPDGRNDLRGRGAHIGSKTIEIARSRRCLARSRCDCHDIVVPRAAGSRLALAGHPTGAWHWIWIGRRRLFPHSQERIRAPTLPEVEVARPDTAASKSMAECYCMPPVRIREQTHLPGTAAPPAPPHRPPRRRPRDRCRADQQVPPAHQSRPATNVRWPVGR